MAKYEPLITHRDPSTQDHAEDIRKARLNRLDARQAELKAELAEIAAKRKAYAPKPPAKKD